MTTPKTSPEFDTFDAAMDMILKADSAQVKAGLAADKEARSSARLKAASEKRHGAFMDRAGARLAKEMGPVHVSGRSEKDDPVLKVFNEVFQKSARRKVN
jgi:hypothetical protein